MQYCRLVETGKRQTGETLLYILPPEIIACLSSSQRYKIYQVSLQRRKEVGCPLAASHGISRLGQAHVLVIWRLSGEVFFTPDQCNVLGNISMFDNG